MQPSPQPQPQPLRKPNAKPGLPPSVSILTKSTLATVVVTCAVIGISLLKGAAVWGGTHANGDVVSQSKQLEREQAFIALANLPLNSVADADIPAAVAGMQLPAPDQVSLLAKLGRTTPTPAAPIATPAATPIVQPALVTAAPIQQLRLAWITLWDTDTEDGDVVRIESQGYSRTVLLAKQPVTFAVPVPADGIIKIAGVRDGEGGGITVGLASGAAQAVFPIMSEGQVLDLRVTVN